MIWMHPCRSVPRRTRPRLGRHHVHRGLTLDLPAHEHLTATVEARRPDRGRAPTRCALRLTPTCTRRPVATVAASRRPPHRLARRPGRRRRGRDPVRDRVPDLSVPVPLPGRRVVAHPQHPRAGRRRRRPSRRRRRRLVCRRVPGGGRHGQRMGGSWVKSTDVNCVGPERSWSSSSPPTHRCSACPARCRCRPGPPPRRRPCAGLRRELAQRLGPERRPGDDAPAGVRARRVGAAGLARAAHLDQPGHGQHGPVRRPGRVDRRRPGRRHGPPPGRRRRVRPADAVRRPARQW